MTGTACLHASCAILYGRIISLQRAENFFWWTHRLGQSGTPTGRYMLLRRDSWTKSPRKLGEFSKTHHTIGSIIRNIRTFSAIWYLWFLYNFKFWKDPRLPLGQWAQFAFITFHHVCFQQFDEWCYRPNFYRYCRCLKKSFRFVTLCTVS